MAAQKPSLQEGINRAGSPMQLLWSQNPPPWLPENIEPEYAGWQAEQAAWHETVSISDVSHHMFDLYIDGPDATRLLSAVSANNYENFAVGQAKGRGRSIMLEITDKGREGYLKAASIVEQVDKSLAGGMTAAERQGTLAGLKVITDEGSPTR